MEEKYALVAYREGQPLLKHIGPLMLDKKRISVYDLMQHVKKSCCGKTQGKKDRCKYCTDGYDFYQDFGRFVLEVATGHGEWTLSHTRRLPEKYESPSIYFSDDGGKTKTKLFLKKTLIKLVEPGNILWIQPQWKIRDLPHVYRIKFVVVSVFQDSNSIVRSDGHDFFNSTDALVCTA